MEVNWKFGEKCVHLIDEVYNREGLTVEVTHIEGELHQTAHVTGVDHG